MLASATTAFAAHGGGRGAPIVNPTTREVAITPDVSVYGASLGFGKSWDNIGVTASIPYYTVDTSGVGSEGGLGDVNVVAQWDVVPEAPNRFSLVGSLLWKLPTADEDKGLGTGETDYGVFVEFAYSSDGSRPFASLGYLWKGDAPTVDYRDTWLYSLGISRRIDYADEVYVSFDAREKTLPVFDDTRLLSAGWLHRLSANHTLQLDVSAGLNDASPDVIVNIGLMTWF